MTFSDGFWVIWTLATFFSRLEPINLSHKQAGWVNPCRQARIQASNNLFYDWQIRKRWSGIRRLSPLRPLRIRRFVRPRISVETSTANSH